MSEAGLPSDLDGDIQRDNFDGQKQPAPFLLDPATVLDSPSVYYLQTEALAKLQAHILRVVKERGAIQVIIAEHGRGKSTLIRELIIEAHSHWKICYIQADYHLGVDHIINGLGQVFFPQEDVDFESLVHGLASYGDQAPYPVVIVDDAQNLSDYAIETLANIKRSVVENGGGINIILCATTALRSVIASHSMVPFREKWMEVHTLPRFSEEEAVEYLSNCFESSEENQFSPSQLQRIIRRGCGIPAYINYYAELVLGRAVSVERLRLEHQKMLARRKKQPYFIGGGVAVILLLSIVIFAFSSSEQDAFVVKSAEVTPTVPAPVIEAAVDEKVTVVPKPVVPVQVIEKPTAVAKAKPTPRPTPTPKSQAVKVEPKVVANAEPQVTVTKVESKPVVKSAPAVVALAPELSPLAEQSPVAVKIQDNPVVATAKVASDESIPGAAWLKAQPPENYTIQLAGSPDEKNIIRYIKRSALEGELAYALLKRNNRSSWFVVVHGSFESRGEALDVVDFFPPALKKHKPWVRQISKLQNALDER